MTRYLVTMGGADYEATVARTVQDAPRFGVDRVRVYDDVWLKNHPFHSVNRWIFDLPGMIGFGWHAWKPLLILDTLAQCNDGDVVLYLDGDTYPLRDLSPLFDRAQSEGLVAFDVQGHGGHRRWCTRDCFVVMGQDEPRYHDAVAGCARFLLVRKGDYKALQLLYEWQTYCLNPYANTRQPEKGTTHGPNLEGFVEHRTDQAILTLLALKYGYPLYQEASQGSAHTPQYFEQLHCTHNRNPGTGSRHFNAGPR